MKPSCHKGHSQTSKFWWAGCLRIQVVKEKKHKYYFCSLFNKSTHAPGVLQASSASADMTSQLQTELRATCTAWTAWAVALRWLNLAATVCDGKPSEPSVVKQLHTNSTNTAFLFVSILILFWYLWLCLHCQYKSCQTGSAALHLPNR